MGDLIIAHLQVAINGPSLVQKGEPSPWTYANAQSALWPYSSWNARCPRLRPLPEREFWDAGCVDVCSQKLLMQFLSVLGVIEGMYTFGKDISAE